MKKFLLRIWRWMPFWLQRIASFAIRPRFQVAVGAIIFNTQKQLLLCEHTYRREYPWGLPGGDLKFGEDPLNAVKREVWEETGLSVQAAELLLVENSLEFHHITLTYLCKGVSGTFVPNEEVSRTQYFDTGALPDFFPEQRMTIDKALSLLNSRSAHE